MTTRTHQFVDQARDNFLLELINEHKIRPSIAHDFVRRCYGRGFSDGREAGAESERRFPHREDMGR